MTTITITQKFNNGLRLMCLDAVNHAVSKLSQKYGFDNDEAVRHLNLGDLSIVCSGSPEGEKNPGLTSNKLLHMASHKDFISPKSQIDFYIENNVSIEIIRYVSLPGKTFGEKYMELLAKEYFNLGNRTSSTHDHTKLNKTIEQKSARYHANGSDWKWQHIEMSHGWDYLLLCGLDFNDIKFYIASRKIVETLIDEGIIVGQGKKIDGVAQPQQAYWFSRSDFQKKNKVFNNYFEAVMDEKSLVKYINA